MIFFLNITMPKKYDKLDHKYIEKLARIRKDNVLRHAGYENTLKLRENIKDSRGISPMTWSLSD